MAAPAVCSLQFAGCTLLPTLGRHSIIYVPLQCQGCHPHMRGELFRHPHPHTTLATRNVFNVNDSSAAELLQTLKAALRQDDDAGNFPIVRLGNLKSLVTSFRCTQLFIIACRHSLKTH